MIGLFLIILTNIVAATVTFISSTGEVFDKSKKGIRKIQKRGWYLLIFLLITISLGGFQYNYTIDQEEKKEKDAKIEAKKDIENSNYKIIRTFTQSLAEYGLKYDSAQKIIERMIRDSVQRNTTIIQENQPVFSLCTDSGITVSNSKSDTLQFTLNFCFKNYPSNLQANLFVLEPIEGKYKLHIEFRDFFTSKKGFEIDGAVSKGPYLFRNHPGAGLFLFYIKGKYTNRESAKSFYIDHVYYYDIRTSVAGYYNPDEIDKIKEQIKLQLPVAPIVINKLSPIKESNR